MRDLRCKLGCLIMGSAVIGVAVLGTFYNNRVCDDGNEIIKGVLQGNTCVIDAQPGNANETVVLNAVKACYAICVGISANNMSAIDDRLIDSSDQMDSLVSSKKASFYHTGMAIDLIIGLVGFIWVMTAVICVDDLDVYEGLDEYDGPHEYDRPQDPEPPRYSDLHRPLLSDMSPV